MKKIDAIRNEYGEFLSESPTVEFDSNDVPVNLQSMIPYASFWGLSDDLDRERLVEKAPDYLKVALRILIAKNEDFLDEWLAGEESLNPEPSDAYIAFSALRMASDYM